MIAGTVRDSISVPVSGKLMPVTPFASAQIVATQ